MMKCLAAKVDEQKGDMGRVKELMVVEKLTTYCSEN
jgi:hypothetical protein